MYQTEHGAFDIQEHADRFNVIYLPDQRAPIQDGRFLAMFRTRTEAESFCDKWRPEDNADSPRD